MKVGRGAKRAKHDSPACICMPELPMCTQVPWTRSPHPRPTQGSTLWSSSPSSGPFMGLHGFALQHSCIEMWRRCITVRLQHPAAFLGSNWGKVQSDCNQVGEVGLRP